MRTTAAVSILAALCLLSAGWAGTGSGRPDTRGESGAAPDIIGMSAWLEADELALAVDFAGDPPLTFSSEGDFTDVLMAFVDEDADQITDGTRNGFSVSVWMHEGYAAAKFAPVVEGQMGLLVPGVATAEVQGNVVTFRVPAGRLPEGSLRVRIVATRYGGEGGMDESPDGGGWHTFTRAELGETDPSAGFGSLLAMLGAALVGALPLIWVTLRIRRMGSQAVRTDTVRPWSAGPR